MSGFIAKMKLYYSRAVADTELWLHSPVSIIQKYLYNDKATADSTKTESMDKKFWIQEGIANSFCTLSNIFNQCWGSKWYIPPICITSTDFGDISVTLPFLLFL